MCGILQNWPQSTQAGHTKSVAPDPSCTTRSPTSPYVTPTPPPRYRGAGVGGGGAGAAALGPGRSLRLDSLQWHNRVPRSRRRASAMLLLVLLACATAVGVAQPIIGGQGKWRFQYRPELVPLPPAEAPNNANGHGLALDAATGEFYFTFQPKAVANATRALVRFSPDGRTGTLLGRPGPGGLAAGTPHGLKMEHDAVAGRTFLYHANNAQKVWKTDLNGTVVWVRDFADWKTERPQYWPILPTDAVVVPGTDLLLVADGYGSSFVHGLNKNTGEYVEGSTFGGKGGTIQPLRFNTPHGISLDPRVRAPAGSPAHAPVFVVSDRSNERLVWVLANGEFVASAPMRDRGPGMALPCNVDTHVDPDAGPVAVVPSLGTSLSDLTGASVGIFNGSNALLSTIAVADLIGDLGHQHPHDAIFLPNGDLVVCCWSGPGNPGQGPAKGTISYWQRLPRK